MSSDLSPLISGSTRRTERDKSERLTYEQEIHNLIHNLKQLDADLKELIESGEVEEFYDRGKVRFRVRGAAC